jgi:CRISPR-associated protein Csb1
MKGDTVMSIEYAALQNSPRLLMEAQLRPLQGDRFQPTGFPDLGPGRYTRPATKDSGGSPDGHSTAMLLVESAQSVANRLELACWDEGEDDLISQLRGLPYVLVMTDGRKLTNSILEAHRINSEYIIESKLGDERFKSVLAREMNHSKRLPIDRAAMIRMLFKRDPNSLLHGAFLEEIDGRYRITRAISGFIEASDVNAVQSGGVKVNRVEPGLKGGKGNVPYPRTEFVASEIKSFLNVDLALLRTYGKTLASEDAVNLMISVALLKVRRFLSSGLRLRTACYFAGGDSLRATEPADFTIPTEDALLEDCARLIRNCAQAQLFASPAITEVVWLREARPIVAPLPAGSPEPKIPEDLEGKVTYRKATDKRSASVEIPQEHGWDPTELAEALFPDHEEARKAVLAELSAKRIVMRDEDTKPKIPKALKEKIRWSKPTKNQDGEIWIASDVGMDAQEMAEILFPDDDAGQNLILGALQ